MAKKTTLSHSRWEVTLRNLRALKFRVKVLSTRVRNQERRVHQLEMERDGKAKRQLAAIIKAGRQLDAAETRRAKRTR